MSRPRSKQDHVVLPPAALLSPKVKPALAQHDDYCTLEEVGDQIDRHVYQPLTSQNSTELVTSPASNEEYVVQPSESPFQLGEKTTSAQPGSAQNGDYCTAREVDGRKSTGSDELEKDNGYDDV